MYKPNVEFCHHFINFGTLFYIHVHEMNTARLVTNIYVVAKFEVN